MSETELPTSNARELEGEVVYFYAFDFAYDMQQRVIATLLGQRLEPLQIDPRKRSPRGQNLFRPLMAMLPPLERSVAGQSVRFEVAVKLLPIGALSFTVKAAFQIDAISQLAHWHDLCFDDGETLISWVKQLAERARQELIPFAIRPHLQLPEGEFYTVFCLQADSLDLKSEAADWLAANRADVAALLTNERGPHRLSAQEIEGSTSHTLSYYRHDLVVVDWDCALVIDHPSDFPETLYVLELANVQLEELEAYDTVIDAALERAYRDLSVQRRSKKSSVLHELKELRMDLARFSDDLQNITKFFGEWHLARVYEHTSRIFHLTDWHRAIDEKLKTLDSLYEMLKQDQNHRVMLWMEAAIVLMFVLDLVMIFWGIGK